MKLITRGEPRIEVLPALQHPGPARGAALPAAAVAAPGPKRPELRFSRRISRVQRYPVEQRLATLPGPSRLGQHLDITV